MIIVCKLTIFNYYFVFLYRDTFKKLAINCVNYKIKLKQSNFERNVKKIVGFEHLNILRKYNFANEKLYKFMVSCMHEPHA